MSEDADNAASEEQGKSSGVLGKLIGLGIVVLLAAVGGMLTYMFVLAPMFEPPPEPVVGNDDDGQKIPPGAQYVLIDGGKAMLESDPGDPGSAILMYDISIVSANPETTALLEDNLQLFQGKFLDIHKGRTRSEVADPQVLRSICRQAEQEGNSLLRRLQEDIDPKIRIVMVLHTSLSVFEQ